MAKKTTNNGKEPHRFKKGNKDGKKFTSEYQPTPEAKSLGYQKKKAIEEIKNEIIEKSFIKAYEILENPEATAQEIISIFKSAIDMSGFKSSKQEVTQKEIKIEVANPDDKALLEEL